MKQYEGTYRSYLKVENEGDLIVIRVDGRAFHTYTRGAKEPFDEMLQSSMNEVARELCENVQGAQFAYVHSDEVSVIIASGNGDRDSIWFDGNIQKMCSISAAIASTRMTLESPRVFGKMRVAQFDSRVFVLPKDELANYLIWRQSDAMRNSVQMLARSLFSHKQLLGKSCDTMKQMVREAGRPWENEPPGSTRGRCVIKQTIQENVEYIDKRTKQVRTATVVRTRWVPIWDIPSFVQDRNFISQYIKKEQRP
jgi:tRNA(His) 5'-end guanylyltransferase